MYSARLDWNVQPNPIATMLADKRHDGATVLDLTESNPTHAGIEYPAESIARAFTDHRVLRYQPEPFGLPETRDAIARYYSESEVPVDASRIALTASTSEAYAWLFKLLADPGDEILTPRPSYPLFEYLARLESVRVVQYPLFYDDGWHLDGAALRTLITPRTRAIVTVNPNNPTGSFLKDRELGELVEVAEQKGLALISDEVFSDFRFASDSAPITVAARSRGALSFSLSGLSKIVGLPQMKLGWMIVGGLETQRAEALRRLELIADTYLSVGTPVQIAAPELLAARQMVQPRIQRQLRENLSTLRAGLRSAPHLRLLEVEGGWYATLQVPRVRSEEEIVLKLLRDRNVLVQPGYFYDFETEAFLVLSLLTRPDVFGEGLTRLLGFLSEST
jgi:alanine-synthesizing transaminase